MRIMVDLDGSISAAPLEFGPILRALKAAGHQISVVSGTGPNTSENPKTAWTMKVQRLAELGCSDCWDDMTVIYDDPNDPTVLANAKAQWCQDNDAGVAIDNNKLNARTISAAGVPLVLVPWATRV